MKDPPQKLLERHFRPHHRPFLAAFVSDWIAWTNMGRRDRDDDDDEEEEEEAEVAYSVAVVAGAREELAPDEEEDVDEAPPASDADTLRFT